MKPGPAISTRATSSLFGSASMMACASSRGLRFALFASCMAALVAKSPCVASRVRSTSGTACVASAGRRSAGRAARASRTSCSIRYFKVLPSGEESGEGGSLGNLSAGCESKQ